MNAMEIRKLAQSLGFKNVAKYRKVELEEMVKAEQAKRAAETINNAKKAAKKAPKQSKRCAVCEVRPVTKDSPESQLCRPCLTKAEWENMHSDYGHSPEGEQPHDCWVCFPELDESSADYVQRKGTSRVGMVLHVTPRATGQDKAKQVAEQLKDFGMASIKVYKGVVTLTLETSGASVKLAWDANGRYLYDSTAITVGGKSRKARNVSAAIKAIKS